MDTNLTIIKNRSLPEIMDYDWLRAKGIEYITQLSSKVWTDYNVHDPGITILEAICYNLTDCGYRSNFDMKDLLARLPDERKKDFYTAREILTCNPVTVLDLKKYIIDQDGVQNAWQYKYLLPAGIRLSQIHVCMIIDPETGLNCLCRYKGEYYIDPDTHETVVCAPSFFYLCDAHAKAYDISLNDPGGYTPMRLNGLYDVVLQLEENEEFGDLNSNVY